jgi:hypothetical protein
MKKSLFILCMLAFSAMLLLTGCNLLVTPPDYSVPTPIPTAVPTLIPTADPTLIPTAVPTSAPTPVLASAYILTVENDGSGTTIPSGSNPVLRDAQTQIAATPNHCVAFTGWTVTSGNPSCISFGNPASASTTVSLSCGDVTIRANFAPIGLQLNVACSAGGIIKIPSTSAVSVTCGVPVSISSQNLSGYQFINWTVVDSGTATFADCTKMSTQVTLSTDTVIEANFCAVSTAPASVSVVPPGITAGSSSTLTVVGGSLGSSSSWCWHTTSDCSDSPIGHGSSIVVYPTITTSYYVRAEGCNNTNPASGQVTILTQYTLTVLPNHYVPSGTQCSYYSGGNAGGGGIVVSGVPTAIVADSQVTDSCGPNSTPVYHNFSKWSVISGSVSFGKASSASTTATLSSNATIQPLYLN